MSSGNIVKDFRISKPLGCGTTLVGRYFTRTWSGTNTPKGAKVFSENPYNLSVLDLVDREMQWKGNSPGETWRTGTFLSCFGGLGVPAVWTSADDLTLQGKLVDQVRSHDFNLAVLLGEGKETMSMITSSATKIAKAGFAVRRGQLGVAARELGVPWKGRVRKTTSANWLELQYGWMPLLKDIDSGAKAIVTLTNKPLTQSFRASLTRTFDRPRPAGGGVMYSTQRITRKTYILRMREQYSAIASLGLLDPELVAWELVPFSFVADWFIPIGNYLDTRANIGRLSGTWIVSTSDKANVSFASSGPNYTIIADGETYYSKSFTFSRTVSSSPPRVPLPSFKPLSKVASWKHCLNALALISQAFR